MVGQSDDSDRAFEDSNNSNFYHHKPQISTNHLQYQQQNNDDITQFTKSEVSCSSKNNGYSGQQNQHINDLL